MKNNINKFILSLLLISGVPQIGVTNFKAHAISEILQSLKYENISISSKNVKFYGKVDILDSSALSNISKNENLILKLIDKNNELVSINLDEILLNNSKRPDLLENSILAELNISGDKINLNGDLYLSNLTIDQIQKFLNDFNLELNLPISNISLTIQNENNETITLNIKNFELKIKNFSITNLNDYLKFSLQESLNMDNNQEKVEYWHNKISNKSGTILDFLNSIIQDENFLIYSKNAEETIEKLYNIILGRHADNDGLKFWTRIFNEEYEKTSSVRTTINTLFSKMTSTKEFSDLCNILTQQ